MGQLDHLPHLISDGFSLSQTFHQKKIEKNTEPPLLQFQARTTPIDLSFELSEPKILSATLIPINTRYA